MKKEYIEGMVVFYKGTELVALSDKAVKYHDEKAKSYRKIAADIDIVRKGENANLSSETSFYNAKSTSMGFDPVLQAENDASAHERKKRFHEQLRDHYDPDALYGLQISELGIYGLHV